MKMQILDRDALQSISPASIAAFAKASGWKKAWAFGDHADIYVRENGPELIIPKNDSLDDYASVVARLIDIFADTSNRDALSIYRDLALADRDVVRVRVSGDDDDGSLPLDAGVKVIAQARDMLLAAACSVRTAPQSFYRAGANKDATEYMKRVKLGQTEHGSFVVTLLAPVPPVISSPQLLLDPDWEVFDEEPLERMVTRRLMDALAASQEAAAATMAGDRDAFERAIPSGVSANLCEAVAGIIEQSNGLEVTLTWARTRPAPEQRRKVVFSRNDAVVLKEAARVFKEKQPKLDVSLFGNVLKLKREEDQIDGVITLKAVIDDQVQSVSAFLDQANYEIAVQSHGAKRKVIVKGDLERVGQRWKMTNATLSQVVGDLETEDE